MTNAINTWNLKHRHSSFSLSLPRAISGRPTVLGLRGDLASSKPRFGAQANGLVLEYGCASLQGTSRKQNEDRFTVDLDAAETAGVPFVAVFDGHGGTACAEWLSTNFAAYLSKYFNSGGSTIERDITETFLAADRNILAPKKSGIFGMMGERGIGGSKCGATGAVAILFKNAAGKPTLVSANAGDARVILGRKGSAIQLSEDHVPDSEDERQRIEAQNPNPRMPLVRYVGGTWRVGGLLALSRAFGDAYLKGTGQFEGIQAGGDGYSSGFGVVAEPTVALVELTADDNWVVLSSDGLFSNEERGGGGGLTNDEVIKMADKLSNKSCGEIAQSLAQSAASSGSTDDVTVVVLRLK